MKRRAAITTGLAAMFGLAGCSAATTPATGSAPTTSAVTPQPNDGTSTIPDIRSHIIELRRLHHIIDALYPSSASSYDAAKIELTAIDEFIRNLNATYADPHHLPGVVVMDYDVQQLRISMKVAIAALRANVEVTLRNLGLLYDPNVRAKGVTPTMLRTYKSQLASAQGKSELTITQVEERLAQ